jgi:hypothetical protein
MYAKSLLLYPANGRWACDRHVLKRHLRSGIFETCEDICVAACHARRAARISAFLCAASSGSAERGIAGSDAFRAKSARREIARLRTRLIQWASRDCSRYFRLAAYSRSHNFSKTSRRLFEIELAYFTECSYAQLMRVWICHCLDVGRSRLVSMKGGRYYRRTTRDDARESSELPRHLMTVTPASVAPKRPRPPGVARLHCCGSDRQQLRGE